MSEIPKTEIDPSDDPRMVEQQQELVAALNSSLTRAAVEIHDFFKGKRFVEWAKEPFVCPSFSEDDDKFEGLYVDLFSHDGHEDDAVVIPLERIIKLSDGGGRDAAAFRLIADAIEKDENPKSGDPHYPVKAAADIRIETLQRENDAAFEKIRQLSRALVDLGYDPTQLPEIEESDDDYPDYSPVEYRGDE